MDKAASVTAMLFALAWFGAGCSKPAPTLDSAHLRMFAALPEQVPPEAGGLTEEKAALGRMLYYEARLSKSQQISCNTCHPLDQYGADGEPTSGGHAGKHGDRNAPTVYNAAAHFVQFWDGRAANVEEQAKGPVLNPVEMALPDAKAVVAVLTSMPEYVAAFQRAFPGEKDPVTFDHAAAAIGAFERRLLTPARWDKFLKGDRTALTDTEKAGFEAFNAAGCQSCHSGALVGGNLYQKLGVMEPYPDTSDLGRYKVTKNEADILFFKAPSLRNVAKTGPYFHNGKVPTLEEAVKQMARYQLGKTLKPGEMDSIVVWLRSLTGEIPAEYIKAPQLPNGTASTPRPEPGG